MVGTRDREKSVDAAKFRLAPLADEDKMRQIFDKHSVTSEHAMVPGATPTVGASHVNLEESEAGSGCEGFDGDDETPTSGKKGKKRYTGYSPNPKPKKKNTDKESRFDCILDMWDIQAADRFGHYGWTISKRFGEILECLYNFAGDVIRPRDPNFSTPHPRLQNRRFWPHFKDAIGEIDGTRIKVVVPADLKVVHINRHGDTSENVLAICDFDMRYTFVVAGWSGSVHDTRVFDDAKVTYLNYPHPSAGQYYLVDFGYPNRTGYLAPYKGQRYHVPEFQHHEPVGMKEVFNHRHSSLRNVIERSFGCPKMKWRILRDLPSYPVDKQKMIIAACMALHNFIRDSALRDGHFKRFEIEEYYQDDVGSEVGVHNAPSSNDDGTMDQKRDEIAQSLMAG